ncbi:MAG: hypothetical protein Fur0018_16450 [Anaerolineales bacterium]
MQNQYDHSEHKPYEKPAIVHELELETRAGSPLGLPNPFDPTGEDGF